MAAPTGGERSLPTRTGHPSAEIDNHGAVIRGYSRSWPNHRRQLDQDGDHMQNAVHVDAGHAPVQGMKSFNVDASVCGVS
jgi:hypothetical protein